MIALLLSNWRLIIGGLVIAGFLLLINHWYSESKKVPKLEYELKVQKLALKIQSEKYIATRKLTSEANDYDYKKTGDSLTLCLNQLRKSSRCVPVYPARTADSIKTASEQPTSGITTGAIIANNISCQADRDSLNAAKIWAQGYIKYGDANAKVF